VRVACPREAERGSGTAVLPRVRTVGRIVLLLSSST
jgi:hypothetical protein